MAKFRFSLFGGDVVQFTVCFLSCLLVPIFVCIDSNADRNGALSIFLLICDAILLATIVLSIGLRKDRRFSSVVILSIVPSLAWYFVDESHLRMCASLRMLRAFVLYNQYISALKRVEESGISDTASRIGTIGLFYAFYASTMACLWFAISCTFVSSTEAHCLSNASWVAEDALAEILDVHSTASRYFRSLHYVTQTLATIGYGDIHPVSLPETLFSLVLILSGALFYGYVISCITSLLSSRDVTTKLFRHALGAVKDYLRLRKVPEAMRDPFVAYFEFLYMRQKGLSEEAVLRGLPGHIALEVRQACCLDTLRAVPFFKARPDSDAFTVQCAARVQLATYGSGSVLSGKACADRVLFLIRSGKVDLVSPLTQRPVLSLMAGDYFGDFHMLFDCPLEVEAVAAGFVEVATLSFTSFTEVLNAQEEEEEEREDREDREERDARGRVSQPSSSRNGGRQRRVTSLVQFTREVKRFSEVVSTAGAADDGAGDGASNGAIVSPVEATMVASDDAAAAQPAQHLAAVRLKPLPARRLAMRVAGVVPVGASGSCSSLEAPIAGAAHLQAQQRPSVPPPSRLIRPEAAGRGGGGGAGAYRMSLRATVDAHQALLARMEKTVQAMHATARTKKLAEMMQQEDAVAHSLTIHPTHLFRCVWRCVLVLVVLYYNLAVPLRIMARYDCGVLGYTTAQCLSSWDWSLVIDYLCDAVVLAEFLLQAQFFAFRRYEGDKVVIETDSRAIWAHFTSSEVYPLLVLLIFPVDVLAPLTGYLLCLRVAKVPSILLLSSVIQELQQWLDQERGVSISAEAVTVAHLSVNTTLVTVWMAVGWCILHYGGAQSSNWISALYWTLTSITTTGYGDITPVNTGQTVYNVCVSIVGPTIFATIIAKFSSYVKKVDVSTSNVEHRLATSVQFVRTMFPAAGTPCPPSAVDNAGSVFDTLPDEGAVAVVSAAGGSTKTSGGSLKIFATGTAPMLSRNLSALGASVSNLLRGVVAHTTGTAKAAVQALTNSKAAPPKRYQVPQELASKQGMERAVAEYFQYMDRGGQGLLESCTVEEFSTHAQTQMRLATLGEQVAGLSLFAKCDTAFHRAVVLAMTQHLYPHRSTLLDGTSPEGLYLVKNGTVIMASTGSDAIQVMHAGQYFGAEVLLGNGQACTVEVTARTDCEVWLLHRADFLRILGAHPQQAEYQRHMRAALQAPVTAVLARQQSISTSVSLSIVKPFMNRLRRTNTAVQEADGTAAAAARTAQLNHTAADEALVLRPDDTAALAWMSLLSLFTFYNFIMIPLRLAYFQYSTVTPVYCVDYLGDACYLADIVLRMNVLAYVDKDEVVLSRKRIWAHYWRSGRVYCDVLSILPFDLIALVAPMGTLGVAQLLSLFRANRLLRLRDAMSGIALLEQCLAKVVTAKSRTQKNLLRLFKLIVAIFLIAHIFGCFFFLIANQLHLAGNTNNWADMAGLFPVDEARGPPSTETILTQYICSVYWAVALLTTVGYGDVSPVSDAEKLYNIALFVVGTLVYATVIVYLQDIVSALDVTSDLFKERIGKVQAFLQREQVPADYVAKVGAYQDKLWAAQRGAQSTEIRDFLPPSLYAASMHGSVGQYLPQLFFVQKCDAAFQQAFLGQLEVAHYLKEDVVFRTGEAADRLYFIAQGDISLVSIDLQTDTGTAAEVIMPALPHRNSILGALVARRGSVDLSTVKPGAPRRRGSTALTTVPAVMRRGSALLLGGSSDGVDGAAGGVGGGGGRKKGRHTSYLKVQDGFVGDTEFFTRACYACSAKAHSDSVLLEMSFATFWALIERFQLQEAYRKHLRRDRDDKTLHRNSTFSVVQRLDNNMANKKMAKMMSVCVTEAPKLQCILPTSPFAIAWVAVSLVAVAALAVCVPYFTAFPAGSAVAQLGLDAVVTVVLSVDMYLHMHKLAVVVQGTLMTDPADIFHHYMATHFWQDALSTFPLGILVYTTTGSREAYGVVRWLTLLRLGKVSGWLNTLLRTASASLGVPLSDAARRALTAVLALLYTAHLAGCLFCCIGRLEAEAGLESWVSTNGFLRGEDGSTYLRSYYWALYTLTTVGYGNLSIPTSGEKVFAMVVMLAGSIFNAMLSALLSSMVESSDQSSSIIRRASEAAGKFCSSNQIDNATQGKVSAYFAYLSNSLDNSPDCEGFGLLSGALRSELVCRTAWRALRKIHYLDPTCYDKVSQQGFILSVTRKMQVYLAVPGEVLASAPLGELLEELRETETRGTGSREAAAASCKVSQNRNRRQQCFYKAIDMMVLRRGKATAEITSLPDHSSNREIAPGQVINLFSIASQLHDREEGEVVAMRRDRRSSSACRPSRLSQNSTTLSGGDDLCASPPAQAEPNPAEACVNFKVLLRHDALQEMPPSAVDASLVCTVATPHRLAGKSIPMSPDLNDAEVYLSFCASLPLEWLSAPDKGERIQLEVHLQRQQKDGVLVHQLVGTVSVDLPQHSQVEDVVGPEHCIDSSNSSCDPSSSDASSDELFTAVDVAPESYAPEQDSDCAALNAHVAKETGDGSSGSDHSDTILSDDNEEASLTGSADPTVRSFRHSLDHSGRLPSKRLSSTASARNSVVPLRCISEESAGTQLSARSPTGSKFCTAVSADEAGGRIVDCGGTVIGKAAVSIQQGDSQPQRSHQDESTQLGEADCNKRFSIDPCSHVRVVAQGYCHLFRASVADCRQLEEFFRLARQPVAFRVQT